MIIYNLQLLLVILIVIPTSYFLSSLNPDFGTLGRPEFWSIVLPIACLSNGIGLNPRLYTIPLWFFSLIIIIWRSYSIYDLNGLLISLAYGLVFIALGVFIKITISKKKWNYSKLLLKEYLTNPDSKNPNILVYYPDYIYTTNPLYEKYFDAIFKSLQNYWFNKKEVNYHYLQLIQKLNQLESSEEKIKQNAYLKSILEKEKKDGIPEYLLDKLKLKISQ